MAALTNVHNHHRVCIHLNPGVRRGGWPVAMQIIVMETWGARSFQDGFVKAFPRLTSFFPDPDVPRSRLAPEDREPWDSRRPLISDKSANQRNAVRLVSDKAGEWAY